VNIVFTMLVLEFVVLCYSLIIHVRSEYTCNSLYSNFLNHLSTMTPYRYVANNNTDVVNFKGCKPWKIWVLQRHGTRTIQNKLYEFVKNRLPEIQRDIVNNLVKCKFERPLIIDKIRQLRASKNWISTTSCRLVLDQ